MKIIEMIPIRDQRLRTQMTGLNLHVAIHLGDVYYSGTGDEEQHP